MGIVALNPALKTCPWNPALPPVKTQFLVPKRKKKCAILCSKKNAVVTGNTN